MGNRSPKPDPRKIAAVNQWFVHNGVGHVVITWRDGRPMVRCGEDLLPGFAQAETPARICRTCLSSIQSGSLQGEKRRRNHGHLTDPQGKLFT